MNKNINFSNIENDEDIFDSGTNKNDSAILNYFVNESMTEDTVVKLNSAKECLQMLKKNSKQDILQLMENYKSYHDLSICNWGPNHIVWQAVPGGILNHKSTFFSLALSYQIKILSISNCHLLAALLFYVKKQDYNGEIFIPYDNPQIWPYFTEEKTSIYQNLLHLPINVDMNGYVNASLFDLINDAIVKPRHLFIPFLSFNTYLHGLTLRG